MQSIFLARDQCPRHIYVTKSIFFLGFLLHSWNLGLKEIERGYYFYNTQRMRKPRSGAQDGARVRCKIV